MFNILLKERVLPRTLLASQKLEVQQTCGIRAARKASKPKDENEEDFVVDVVIKPKTIENVHRPYMDFTYNRLQQHMAQSYVIMKIQKQFREMYPKVYPSLQQRLFELNPENHDPELHKKINIGMSYKKSKSEQELRAERKAHIRALKEDRDLVWKANHNELEVDIAAVQRDSATQEGPRQARLWALHCHVFQHLFGPYAFFDPVVPLRVTYDYSDEEVSRAHCGNILKPHEARSLPEVSFPSAPDALWSLLLTNPDGDLYKHDSECCHWLVTNIKGGDLSTGSTLVPYLPPCPPRGVGYQRMVFVLFRQEGAISHEVPLTDAFSLPERSWSTLDFYRKHEDDLTPAGLCWYHTDWDHTMPDYFHNTLGMLEPVYEYDFPLPYVEPIEEYPEKVKDFTTYTEAGKPAVELEEIALLERLKRVHPFKVEAKPLPFPEAVFKDVRKPSWTRVRVSEERQGLGRAKKQFRNDYLAEPADCPEELERVVQLEVEKGYTAPVEEVRKEVYLGVKKRKVIQAERRKAMEEDRLSRVQMANLKGETVGDLEKGWKPGKVDPFYQAGN